MLRISEVLSNPAGKDAGSEWIELEAIGSPVSLSGYRLENGAGRTFLLPARLLAAGERAVIEPSFTIRNSNEKIFLKRGAALADSADLPASAPEGKSYNRLGAYFLPGEPTPAAPNVISGLESLRNDFPPGPLNAPVSNDALWLALAAGVLLSAYGMLLFIHALPPRDHHPLS